MNSRINNLIMGIAFLLSAIIATPISAQQIGDQGLVFDNSKNDPDYPFMKEWQKSGVEGGIPLRGSLPIKLRINPTDANGIQSAIQSVNNTNGPVVILLKKGTYRIDKPITLKSNIILRGESKNEVKLQVFIRSGSNNKVAMLFKNISKAALEDLSFEYIPPKDITLYDDRNVPLNKYCGDKCFSNNPQGVKNMYVSFVRLHGSTKNCWIDNCNFKNAGSDPIEVWANNNTLRNNFVDACFNKGGGGNGYYDIRGNYNLFVNEKVRRIRHFAIQNNAKFNVVINCEFEVDVNFHNGDDGYNLIEGNKIKSLRWRSWGAFASGGSQYGHEKPGNNNLIFNNQTSGRNNSERFGGDDKVFVFDQYKEPRLKRNNPPKYKTLYPIILKENNQPPVLSFKTLQDGDTLDKGTSLKPVVLASDPDGSIVSVELFLNNDFVRKERFAPYEWGHLPDQDSSIKNLETGIYTLKAIAEDNIGYKVEQKIRLHVTDNKKEIINGLFTIRNYSNKQNIIAPSWDDYNARMYSSEVVYSDHKWNIKHLENYEHTIQNLGTERFLEVPFGNCDNSSNVSTYTNATTNHQKWYIEKVNNLYYLIPVHCNSKALDKNNGKNGNVHLWNKDLSNKNQQFILNSEMRDHKENDTPFIDEDEMFKISKNPVSEKIQLEIYPNIQKTINYSIINIFGQVISKNKIIVGNHKTTEIDIQNIPQGTYILKIYVDDFKKSWARKFVKI